MTFFDTNAIIDILDSKRANHKMAIMLLSAAQKGAIKIVSTTQTIVDASYVINQANKVPVEELRRALSLLCDIITVCPVLRFNIEEANDSQLPDYEDSVQLSCATCEDCDCIVTRDKKFKSFTNIPTYTVEEYYRAIFEE